MTHTPVSDQDTPEQDAVRIRYARVTLAGKQIAALRNLRLPPGHRDAQLLRGLIRTDMSRISPEELHVLDGLCWRWRRHGLAHLAPKLNPDDPIVKAGCR